MSTKQNDGIRLSKKHGVNPTICKCAWCGKSTNTVALLGELEGDVEAPMYSVVDYEPCDDCKERWSAGVALIEVVEEPIVEKQIAIAPGVYPTGRVVVIDANEHTGKAGDIFFITPEQLEQIFVAGQDNEYLQ